MATIKSKKPSTSLLGYVFGYKKTEKIENKEAGTVSYQIKFVSDTRTAKQGYPHKFRKEKDFYCEEVHEGDVCRLAVYEQEFFDSANRLLECFSGADKPHFIEEYATRKYSYATQLSLDAFLAYTAVRHACMEFGFMRMDVPDSLALSYLSKYAEFQDQSVYAQCIEDDIARYEKEVAQALS